MQTQISMYFLGKSHYLFMVWFSYDQAMFLTDKEYKARNRTVSPVAQGSLSCKTDGI